jgi:tetratricopeptide (TPR) repeat protein
MKLCKVSLIFSVLLFLLTPSGGWCHGTELHAAEQAKKEARALVSRASRFENVMEPEQAIALCDRAIALDPQCWAAYQARANSWNQLGHLDKAFADLAAIVKGGGGRDRYDALKRRADLYFHEKRYNECMDDLTAACKIAELTDGMYIQRGRCYEQFGKPLMAARDYGESLKGRQDDVARLTLRGNAYLEGKQVKAALADFNHVIDLYARNQDGFGIDPGIYRNRARAYDRLGMKKDAERDRLQADRIEAANLAGAPFRSGKKDK